MGKVHLYDADYDPSRLAEVAKQIFDDFPRQVEGKTVLLKPNILGPFEADRAITTHPEVIRALVKELKSRGANVQVGDNPGMRGYGANELCGTKSGILDASDGCVNLSEDAVRTKIESRFVDEVTVSRKLLEADILITVPKFKTHLVTMITGAIKNSYGFLVGGQKSELHRLVVGAPKFSEVIVDVYQVRVPDLCIMDGIVGMEGKGPSSPYLRDIGKILVADNGVEMDAVMTMMMGVEPREIFMLQVAQERGLGEIDRDKIDIQGELPVIPDFKFPATFMKGSIQSVLAKLLTYVMVDRPVPKLDICTKCGMCAKHCPVDAITMDPFPKIDKKKCILCFCCNEFCKQDAMGVAKRIQFARSKLDY